MMLPCPSPGASRRETFRSGEATSAAMWRLFFAACPLSGSDWPRSVSFKIAVEPARFAIASRLSRLFCGIASSDGAPGGDLAHASPHGHAQEAAHGDGGG